MWGGQKGLSVLSLVSRTSRLSRIGPGIRGFNMAPAAVELLHCAFNTKPVQNDGVAKDCTAPLLGHPQLGDRIGQAVLVVIESPKST